MIHISLLQKVHPIGGGRVSTLAQKNEGSIVKLESPDDKMRSYPCHPRCTPRWSNNSGNRWSSWNELCCSYSCRPYGARYRATNLRWNYDVQGDQRDRGTARRMGLYLGRRRTRSPGHSICEGDGATSPRNRYRRRQAGPCYPSGGRLCDQCQNWGPGSRCDAVIAKFRLPPPSSMPPK